MAYSEAVVERVAARDDGVQRLGTAPRIGPITAAALRATVDDAQRFRDAHQFEAYIGLVPSEMSSGEKQRRGNITGTGDSRLRWLLVQAAHRIRYDKGGDTVGLRQRWVGRRSGRWERGASGGGTNGGGAGGSPAASGCTIAGAGPGLAMALAVAMLGLTRRARRGALSSARHTR